MSLLEQFQAEAAALRRRLGPQLQRKLAAQLEARRQAEARKPELRRTEIESTNAEIERAKAEELRNKEIVDRIFQAQQEQRCAVPVEIDNSSQVPDVEGSGQQDVLFEAFTVDNLGDGNRWVRCQGYDDQPDRQRLDPDESGEWFMRSWGIGFNINKAR